MPETEVKEIMETCVWRVSAVWDENENRIDSCLRSVNVVSYENDNFRLPAFDESCLYQSKLGRSITLREFIRMRNEDTSFVFNTNTGDTLVVSFFRNANRSILDMTIEYQGYFFLNEGTDFGVFDSKWFIRTDQ